MNLFITPKYKNNLDLITLYRSPQSIECGEKLLYEVLIASLYQKHEILIIKAEQLSLPTWNPSKRWEVGESWLWLSARSKSTIVKTFCGTSVTLCQLSEFLSLSK